MEFILVFGLFTAAGLIYYKYRDRIKRSWHSLRDEFRDSQRD